MSIHYEKLAKAAYERERALLPGMGWPEWGHNYRVDRAFWERASRAVVAALAEQGLCVVRAEDITFVDHWLKDYLGYMVAGQIDAWLRLRALAAPGDGGEEQG